MSVLDRSALSDSPLADLHAIAAELSIDGYRRLRRPELIDAILEKQGASPRSADASDGSTDDGESGTRRRRGRRGGRSRTAPSSDEEAGADEADADAAAETAGSGDDAGDEATAAPRRTRSRATRTRAKAPTDDIDAEVASSEAEAQEPARPARSRRGRGRGEAEAATPARATDDDTVEGVVELLANGSGFVRAEGAEPSDDDVYISAAQVKRCELVSGDRVAGPKRAPRRSERFASLIRVETINGRPASEQAEGVRFDDLPASLPTERITVGSEDPTLAAIEWLTPFGRGSRVTVTGPSRAGKTAALRLLAAALADADGLTVTVALAGTRPEEVAGWTAGPVPVTATVTLAGSEEAQTTALEGAVDQARRLAARGEHAVLLIDGLDGIPVAAARRLMASARCIVDGGSVTMIATAAAPVGGETTVISLDLGLASIGRFPNLDLLASGTLHPELLVGEDGAEVITRTRAELLGEDGD